MFIYLIKNPDWDHERKYKFGFTKDPVSRRYNYHMNSSYSYTFVYLCHLVELANYCINLKEYDKIFSQIGRDIVLIQYIEEKYHTKLPYLYQLNDYLVNNGGGIEFIKYEGLELIIQIINEEFPKIGLYADKIYNNEELEQLNQEVPVTDTSNLYDCLFTNNNVIKPFMEQYIILNMIEEFYEQNNIGKIIWPCGMGKAMLSLFIAQKMGFKHIVIGVPSIYLQKQFRSEIRKLYPNMNDIMYIGGTPDETTQSTTDKTQIMEFIREHSMTFLITTYTSCGVLTDLYDFDFKIGDEAHHLVGEQTESSYYLRFHQVSSRKSLFMTATEKYIDPDDQKKIYSMDNEALFGKLIDYKSICWAIENKKITGYNLLVLRNTNQEVDAIIKQLNIEDCNRELIVSAYMSLKALETYHGLTHLLIYVNTIQHSDLVKSYVDKILKSNIITNNHTDIYNNSLHSQSSQHLTTEVAKFSAASKGIMSCVYIFGEGFDMPKLNGVVFGESMESDIRIVQSALRPNRLEKGNPDKIAYIIIPTVDQVGPLGSLSHFENGTAFNKCFRIISKMGNFDDNVEMRIKLATLTKKKDDDTGTNNKLEFYNDLVENINDLNNLKLKLKHRRALKTELSPELTEYLYVKSINKSLNIQNKVDYANSIDKHEHYIDNPEIYFNVKGVWNDWYDFFDINTQGFISNKTDWKKFCFKYDIKTVQDYERLCLQYPQLPRDPAEYYRGFSNIATELHLGVKRR